MTINTLRTRQNGRRFADDTLKRIFLNENVRIFIKISLKLVPNGAINNNPPLVQIMAWCQSGDKPLSEPMIVSLLTHICVTQPQWVKVSATTSLFAQQLVKNNCGKNIKGPHSWFSGWHQAIIWTYCGILLIGPLGTIFSEILIKIYTFSLKKMHLKMSSGKCQPFCLGLNVLY